MLTKLIQAALIGSSLMGTLLMYYLFTRLSEGVFTAPVWFALTGVIAVYIYGAAAFMTIKGIHPFAKTGRVRQ